jgi:nucleoside-diphosphate-sugar epimerase
MVDLITGAEGFIGGRLFQCGDRTLVRRAGLIPTAVTGDLLNPSSLEVACRGISTVFHCAGYAHANASSNSNVHWRVNYEGTLNLLNAAGRAGVRCFVFLSSVKAMADPGDDCADEDLHGPPLTPYGLAKRAAEAAVLDCGSKFGMHVVILRLAMVYGRGGRGNLERMARAIQSGWFPPLPKIRNKRSLVHVQDVCEVMRLVASRPEADGKTYIVSDPQPYSSREIYEAINTALGFSTSPKYAVPVGLLRAVGCVNRRAREIIDRLLGSAFYSPDRIERELGWRARVSLGDGLKEMLSNHAI